MHNSLKSISITVRQFEKRNLNLEQKKMVNAFKVIIQSYQEKINKGITLTLDDERILNALLTIVIYMVKESSSKLNVGKIM